MKYVSYFLLAFLIGFVALPASLKAVTCLGLSRDLSYGVNDSKMGGEVKILQNYLVSSGYLSATPNGNYGPATVSAVKKFQRANGITETGTVGPLTRAALAIKSCYQGTSSSQTETQTQTQTQSQTTTQNQTNTSSETGIKVTSPVFGESFDTDEVHTVKWVAPAGTGPYNIVLENASGTPMGFVIYGTYGNQYSWKVGTVHNTSTGSTGTVPPGSYRIHAQSSGGAQSTDVLSGVFKIEGSIYISQIFPRAVTADNSSSVAIFGSNFKPESLVKIYGYGETAPQFVSNDGKIIVFTVPNSVYPGPHSISIINRYTSSDVVIESNTTDLNIIRQ